MEIKLGQKVRDKITGFSGIATARVVYLYGCVRVEITSKKIKEDKPVTIFFDENGIEVIGNGIRKKTKPPAGPKDSTHYRHKI